MNTAVFVVSLVVFVVVVFVAMFSLITRGIRRATEAQRAALESEGIVMDSGRVPIAIHYNGFRGQGMYIGVGVNRGAMIMVLTKQRLAFVPSRRSYLRIDRADLHLFKASTTGGVLRFQTDTPPNASGTLDFHISVRDPAAWVAALTEAGAKA